MLLPRRNITEFWNRWHISITLLLALNGWVFFRAATFADSRFAIENLWHGPLGTCNWTTSQFGLFVLTAATAIFEGRLIQNSALSYAIAIAAMLLILEVFAVTDVSIPFVYFQF